jgi:hypothetical protein
MPGAGGGVAQFPAAAGAVGGEPQPVEADRLQDIVRGLQVEGVGA